MADNSEQKKASTVQQALLAELFTDINDVTERTEALLDKCALVEQELSVSTKALVLASQKYKDTINTFTNEAKSELKTHIEAEIITNLSPTLIELLQEQQKPLNANTARLNKTMNIQLILIVISCFIGLSGIALHFI